MEKKKLYKVFFRYAYNDIQGIQTENAKSQKKALSIARDCYYVKITEHIGNGLYALVYERINGNETVNRI